VLPAFRNAISPLAATRLISLHERYQSLCGLTEEDVEALVTRTLRDYPKSDPAGTLNSIRYWYGGFMFSSNSENPALYNPQQVFIHLQDTISDPMGSHIDTPNSVHTSKVLSLVGKIGPVTIHSLVDMLSSKANAHILSEFSFDDLMQEQEIRPKNVTWSLLYYLGIVTFHKDSGCQVGTDSLCAPNCDMARLVSTRMSCLGE
jgi:Predicted AAA-ATPase